MPQRILSTVFEMPVGYIHRHELRVGRVRLRIETQPPRTLVLTDDSSGDDRRSISLGLDWIEETVMGIREEVEC